jgi:hypothetical protein
MLPGRGKEKIRSIESIGKWADVSAALAADA